MSQDINQLAEVHAKAIAAGDFETALQDFSAELAPKVPSMVPLLPEGLNAAEVLSIEPQGDGLSRRGRRDSRRRRACGRRRPGRGRRAARRRGGTAAAVVVVAARRCGQGQSAANGESEE